MRLTTQGNMGEFVQLVSNKMTYLGPSDLTQYFIRGTRPFIFTATKYEFNPDQY